MKNLLSKIQNKESVIGIIGLGYVGLPISLCFVNKGFKTIGFDIDKIKIDKLKQKKSYINGISDKVIQSAIESGFYVTSNFANISKVDVIIICVPTPLGSHKEPDLSFIINSLDLIKSFLKENSLLVLESTTYPGTTEEKIIPFIEKEGYNIGENFFVGYSPEREDPGNKNFSTNNIPKVVSGYTKTCLELTNLLYAQIIEKTVPVSSIKVAEMTKIVENIHRAVNIGLVNELKILADKMNINIFEVIDAAATKPFGFTPYYPGPGLGGHCIPIDPYYLTWKAKEIGMSTRFIELAGEINTAMPNYVIQQVSEALNSASKAVNGCSILILGLAYKKNVDDTRESPSLVIMDMLMRMGANVDYSDPYLSQTQKTRKFDFKLKSVEINKKNIKSYDAIIICTDHDEFDYELINNEAQLIIDTRGRLYNEHKLSFKNN